MTRYLLHPERAEDVHVVARPSDKPGMVGVVVREEVDSVPSRCHPKGLCFCRFPGRATRDFAQALFFPGWLSVRTPIYHLQSLGATCPVAGTIKGYHLGCCLGSIALPGVCIARASLCFTAPAKASTTPSPPRTNILAVEAALLVFSGLWGPPTIRKDR